jgi:hypothetical protein
VAVCPETRYAYRLLTMLSPENEHRVWAYLMRVPAYLLIVAAIIRKNTGRTSEE